MTLFGLKTALWLIALFQRYWSTNRRSFSPWLKNPRPYYSHRLDKHGYITEYGYPVEVNQPIFSMVGGMYSAIMMAGICTRIGNKFYLEEMVCNADMTAKGISTTKNTAITTEQVHQSSHMGE